MGRRMKEENWIVEELLELQAKLYQRRTPIARYVFRRLKNVQLEINKRYRENRQEITLPLFEEVEKSVD